MLALSFACALVLAFALLQFVVKVITREQYNVTDEPRRIRAIVMVGPALSGGGAIDAGRGGATSGPYLLPAAAPRNRFARLRFAVVDSDRKQSFNQSLSRRQVDFVQPGCACAREAARSRSTGKNPEYGRYLPHLRARNNMSWRSSAFDQAHVLVRERNVACQSARSGVGGTLGNGSEFPGVRWIPGDFLHGWKWIIREHRW